jgi:hypothetical protein
MTWWSRWQLLAIAVALCPPAAGAKLCGDDVGGRDVPCACGDVVVSDVALDGDPVLAAPCPGDGLVVRAPRAAHGVTVDLRGGSLEGSGRGRGLWIIHGGPGGARVVSSAGPSTVLGFRDGIVGAGPASVALIEGVLAVDSGRDGVRVRATGYEIRNTEAWGSGRDGFRLGGRAFRVQAAQAVASGRRGYAVRGRDGRLGTVGDGVVAVGSGRDGLRLTGTGHRVRDCLAVGARRDGVRLSGTRLTLSGCRAENNDGAGIAGRGLTVELTGNQARGNRRSGLSVAGVDVADAGGNGGSGNGAPHQALPAVQCRIGERPCGW